jgi:hypothetical protein
MPILSSPITAREAFTGTAGEQKIVALLLLRSSTVTGAAITSMIPIPTTSPVLIGELLVIESPCDEIKVKPAPAGEVDDCVATHQSSSYLPASCRVMMPVALS